jgi:hypothetical protein
VGDELVWHVFALSACHRDGIGQVGRRPGADRSNQQVQATRSVHLVLVGTVAELAALADEDGRPALLTASPSLSPRSWR